MKLALRLLAIFVVAFALVVVVGRTAYAQNIDMQASVDTNEVELGDSIVYQLQAMSKTKEQPGDPQLPTHPGFTIVGSSASPSHMVSIINGHATESHGLNVQWRLRADRLGTFSIGPGSVAFGGGRASGSAQKVTVIAPGTGRPKRRPRDPFGGGSPFDPFKGFFDNSDDQDMGDPFRGLQTDPKLSMATERAPVAFLHATIDKSRVVVGEQVTLSVYLYEDLHQRQGRPSDVHEATATDFVKRSLLQDESRAILVGNAMVGGKPWSVKLVRKSALFPIKAGRLQIDPMSLTVPSARLGLRESEKLEVDVVEPPVTGRPAGYQLGDTGDFSIAATITPRTMEQHGAVGVNVEVRGTGNIPSTIAMPEIAGVEWLEPQVRDALGPVTQEQYGGTRTFNYVGRVHNAGQVDLGEVRLPYFDPRTRAYNVARAALGIVSVAKSDGRDAGADEAPQVLPDLPSPRTALEGRKEQSFVTEKPIFWLSIFGSPLACALVIVANDALKRAREKRANATPSNEKIAKDRRAEAEAALSGTDGKAAAGAIIKAIETEILAEHGVNLRGTSGEKALAEMTEAGLSESAAKEVQAVLAECESAKFAPADVDVAPIRELWQRARKALGE